MNTSSCTIFIWGKPCSSPLDIDRKTPSSAAVHPGPKWGIWFILEPKIYGDGATDKSLTPVWLITLPWIQGVWLYSNASVDCWQHPNLDGSNWKLEETIFRWTEEENHMFAPREVANLWKQYGWNDRFVGWFWYICMWTLTQQELWGHDEERKIRTHFFPRKLKLL